MWRLVVVFFGILFVFALLHGVVSIRVWRDAFYGNPDEWESGYNPRKRIMSYLLFSLVFIGITFSLN